MTADGQQVGETGPDAHLGRLVEVDDDVAAEDNVELSLERPLGHQVELVVGDQALQAVIDLMLAATVDLDLLEPLLAQRRRNGFERLIIIGALTRDREDLRIDVGREDLEIVIEHVGEGLKDRQRDRIGFLAVRTGGRPDAHAPTRLGALDQTRQNLVTQMVEMMVLRKKRVKLVVR